MDQKTKQNGDAKADGTIVGDVSKFVRFEIQTKIPDNNAVHQRLPVYC